VFDQTVQPPTLVSSSSSTRVLPPLQEREREREREREKKEKKKKKKEEKEKKERKDKKEERKERTNQTHAMYKPMNMVVRLKLPSVASVTTPAVMMHSALHRLA
jgi:ABC-type Zn2+ transport system substrate-binding protein/surface adhesin